MSKGFCTIPNDPLYKELHKTIKNHDRANLIYGFTKSKEFKLAFGDKLLYDSNGNPTIESVLSLFNDDLIQHSTVFKDTMETSLNANMPEHNVDIVRRVVEFNKKSTPYYARITDINGKASKIVLQERSNDTSYVDALEENLKMFDNIDNYLKKLGIGVRILDPEFFNGEDAIMIASNVNPLKEGLFGVINIANNMAGFNAITEEFSHFIVECCKDNPIIQRCETYLNNHPEMLQDILGADYTVVSNYYEKKGKSNLIAREALGRILMQQIQSDSDALTKENSLLERAVNNLKKFVDKFHFRDQSDINSYEELVGQLTKTSFDFIQDRKLTDENREMLSKFGDSLAHTQTDLKTNIDTIVDQLSRNASKYVAVYKKQNKELTDVLNAIFYGGMKQLDPKAQQSQLNAIYADYVKHPNAAHRDVLMQMIRYKTIISSSNVLFSQQFEKLIKLHNDLRRQNFTMESILRNSHQIRQFKNLVLVYQESIQDLLNELTDVDYFDDYSEEELSLIDAITDDLLLLQRLTSRANNEIEKFSYELVYHFYLDTFNPNGDDTITIAGSSLNKETTISLTDILHFTYGDISAMNRLLDTGYNSSDILTQLVSTKIKQQQEQIRQQTVTEVQNLSHLLDKYGKDTDFLYERKNNNSPTGYYINKYGIDFYKFDQEKKRVFAEIDARTYLSDDEKSIHKAKWYSDNTRPITLKTYSLVNGLWVENPNNFMTVKIPVANDSRWSSDAYSKLSTQQKQLCDELLEYKHKLDYINGLSGNFRPFKCVQKAVSSLTESVINRNASPLDILKRKMTFTDEDLEQYGDMVNENLMSNNTSFFSRIKSRLNGIFTAPDEEVAETVTQLSDFEGKLYRRVPLSYVNDLQEVSKLSTNTFDALLHYTAATYQHEGMNQIVDIMELTKSIANKREQKQFDSRGRRLVSRHGQDRNQVQDITYNAAGSNMNQQLENIINTQIYAEYKKKGATILNDKISVSKLTDGILRLTSLSMLGYNPFTAINNVIVGKSQMLIQSFGDQYYSTNDWLKADKEYLSLLRDYLGELSSPFKTSKLALIEQTFNPHNNWWEQVVQKGIYKPNALRVAEMVLGPSFMMQAGEHHMKMSTCLALLYGTKMIHKVGNKTVETNLYDALEEVWIPNSNGQGKHKELRIKSGYTKPDGSEFVLNSQGSNKRSDLQEFTDKMTITNHRMHGIYDKEDYIEAKQYVVGRIFLLFRNFMFPFFSRRWKGLSTLKNSTQLYNVQLNSVDEGYYVTTLKFLKQMFFPNTQSLRNSGGLKERYKMLVDGLSESEKHNFYQMFAESITTLITWALLLMLFRDWDDDEGSWLSRATNYFTRRLQSEMTYAWNPSTLMDILQSPTPVMSPLKDIARLIKSIGDDHILQTGPYKGQTRFKANLKRAMPIIPNVIDFFNLDTEDKKFKVFEDTFFYKNSSEENNQ